MIVKEFEIKAIYIPNAIKMFFVQKFNIQYNIYHILISTIVHITTTRLRDSIFFNVPAFTVPEKKNQNIANPKNNKRLIWRDKLLKLSISKKLIS